jgi:hypothetical protein
LSMQAVCSLALVVLVTHLNTDVQSESLLHE